MRYTKHDLAIAILKVYEQIKPKAQNKSNALGGRAGSTGDIEAVLQTTFTPEERALAGQVVNDLVDRGLLTPTWTDTVEPENWLVITGLGEQALQSGALDELDNLLLGLHSADDLLKMRNGAYEAMAAQNTDWQRHAATSCRELVTKVLHTIAPDTAVRADPLFKPDSSASSGITRKQRIKYYLREKGGSASNSDTAVVEKACDLVEACYTKLSAITHTDQREVEELIKLTENALYFLLS